MTLAFVSGRKYAWSIHLVAHCKGPVRKAYAEMFV